MLLFRERELEEGGKSPQRKIRSKEEEERKLSEMHRSRSSSTFFDADEAQGMLVVRLSNKDPTLHSNPRLNEPEVTADVKRRKVAQRRRHIHGSDLAADVADLKGQVAGLEAKLDLLLEKVG